MSVSPRSKNTALIIRRYPVGKTVCRDCTDACRRRARQYPDGWPVEARTGGTQRRDVTAHLHRIRWVWPAVLCVVVLIVTGCGRPPEEAQESDVSPPLIDVTGEPAPTFDFPVACRTDDASLNAFIERFFSACSEGRYEDYRLLCSRYTQPLSREQFRQSWDRVQSVHVIEVAPRASDVPTDPGDASGGRKDSKSLAWKLTARVAFDETVQPSERTVGVVIFYEEGQWVLGRPSETLPTSAPASPEEPA
jgi:hypothetical protein